MAKHLAENNIKTIGGESIIGTGDIFLSVPSLQEVTQNDGNNVTNTSIHITGRSNRTTNTGLEIAYERGAAKLTNFNTEFQPRGSVNINNHGVNVGVVGELLVSFAKDTDETTGTNFQTRVGGNEAILSNEFITKSQLDNKPIPLRWGLSTAEDGNLSLGTETEGFGERVVTISGVDDAYPYSFRISTDDAGLLFHSSRKIEVEGTLPLTYAALHSEGYADGDIPRWDKVKAYVDAKPTGATSLHQLTTGANKNATGNALFIIGANNETVGNGMLLWQNTFSGASIISNKLGATTVSQMVLGANGFHIEVASEVIMLSMIEDIYSAGVQFGRRVKGKDALNAEEFVTKRQSARSLTMITDGTLSVDRASLNAKFPNAVVGDRYCNNNAYNNTGGESILVECLGNGEWWIISTYNGNPNIGLAVDA